TLEHVPRPVEALAECRRVLRNGGVCAFTVPQIVGRLSIARAGLPSSYHGSSANPSDCLVHTEYGADAWKHVIQAGFDECRISVLEYPAALALIGVRNRLPLRVDEPRRRNTALHTKGPRKLRSVLVAVAKRVTMVLHRMTAPSNTH